MEEKWGEREGQTVWNKAWEKGSVENSVSDWTEIIIEKMFVVYYRK